MRETPLWSALEAIAPTLVYDCTIADATPLELVRTATAPTLVIDSDGSASARSGMRSQIPPAGLPA